MQKWEIGDSTVHVVNWEIGVDDLIPAMLNTIDLLLEPSTDDGEGKRGPKREHKIPGKTEDQERKLCRDWLAALEHDPKIQFRDFLDDEGLNHVSGTLFEGVRRWFRKQVKDGNASL